ncbi:MAG: glycosyltransferase [Ignavibacteria bacterium]|nr:glycosyltransferase [Ignavibacteria bacterium]
MKKILFKSHNTGFGGIEKIQSIYINYLANQSNFETKIVFDMGLDINNVIGNNIDVPIIHLVDNNRVTHFNCVSKNRNNSVFDKINFNIQLIKNKNYKNNRFKEICNAYKPDIFIDFHNFHLNKLKYVTTSKTMTWMHINIESWLKNKNKIKKYLNKISKYDKIICVSEDIRNNICHLDNTLKNKTLVLYNPIDIEQIKTLANEEFTTDEMNYLNSKYLLMVSRLDTVQKDFQTLFTAFDLAKNNGYDGNLYIIGTGGDTEINQINSLKNKCKFNKNIYLLGGKINPYNWMKNCDKFILSSNYEGFGMVVAEALTVNNSVICSNCPSGPAEILENGKNGYLFNVGNSDELSELILNATPKDRNIIDLSLNRFSHINIINQFDKIINNI